MYRTLFWFLLPLVITELIYELGIQVINGGIARVPRPTETLAAYGIAWGLTSFLTGTVSQNRQMSMVLVRDRATFHTVFRCVAGFGGVHFLVLSCLAFTPVGLWVIDELHAVDSALGGTVRRALGLLLPIPLIVGITRFLSGLLLRVRRTDIVSYAMMAGISMSVVSVFLFLPTPTVQADPILLPVAATYFGVLTELAVIIYGYRRFVRRSLRRGGSTDGEPAAGQKVVGEPIGQDVVGEPTGQDAAGEPVTRRQHPLTAAYVLRFYWPLAVTIGIQALSRPIINLFVARGTDGTESLAVLTIVYALAHLPYGWLNELKNLPPAFQRQDPDGRIIPTIHGHLRFDFIRDYGPHVLDPGAVLPPRNADRRGSRFCCSVHCTAGHLLLLSPGRHSAVLPARDRAAGPPDGRHRAQRPRPGRRDRHRRERTRPLRPARGDPRRGRPLQWIRHGNNRGALAHGQKPRLAGRRSFQMSARLQRT